MRKKDFSRRQVLGTLGGMVILPVFTPRAFSQTQNPGASSGEPHFFIHLLFAGGWDPNYLFDARPLALTDRGLYANYAYKNLPGEEKLQDASPRDIPGQQALGLQRSPLTDDLMQNMEKFCVVNGIHFKSNVHELNVPNLMNGLNSGGNNFVAAIGAKLMGTLDCVNFGAVSTLGFLGSNFANSVALQRTQNSLNTAIKNFQIPAEADPALQALAQQNQGLPSGGDFGQGIKDLGSGFGRMPSLMQKFKKISDLAAKQREFIQGRDNEQNDDERQALITTAVSYIKHGITGAANIIFDYDQGQVFNLDVHNPLAARKQVITYRKVVNDINHLVKTLADTWYDESRNLRMSDVTTVMMSSELGRTRTNPGDAGRNIVQTGTDHNAYGGSAILFGKGIRGGQVIGMNDLKEIDGEGKLTNVSGAHKEVDSQLLSPMGLPFDFQTEQTVTDTSVEKYDPTRYITMENIVNTVMSIFGIDSSEYQRVNGDAVPPIKKIKLG